MRSRKRQSLLEPTHSKRTQSLEHRHWWSISQLTLRAWQDSGKVIEVNLGRPRRQVTRARKSDPVWPERSREHWTCSTSDCAKFLSHNQGQRFGRNSIFCCCKQDGSGLGWLVGWGPSWWCSGITHGERTTWGAESGMVGCVHGKCFGPDPISVALP